MKATTARRLFYGSALVVFPLAFYGGGAIKEYFLAGKLGDDVGGLPGSRAKRARIVQLAQERVELLDQKAELDRRITELTGKMAGAARGT